MDSQFLTKKRKRYSHQSSLRSSSMAENNKAIIDRISEQPEEVIYSILSHLSIRDVTRASVLSRRWRPICASMSVLKINFTSMFTANTYDGSNSLQYQDTCMCKQHKDKFVKGVNQLLHDYDKRSLLRSLSLTYSLEENNTFDIDQWATFAVTMGVEELSLAFLCKKCYIFDAASSSRSNLYTLRSEILSRGNNNTGKVRCLYLVSCILGPGVINLFSNLRFLNLAMVNLGTNGFETIMSCCLNLEVLRVSECALIPTLCIPDSLNRLKEIVLCKCSNVEEINISSKSMEFFSYSGHCITFSFSKALNLKHICFRVHDEESMQYVYNKLSKDLPWMETLFVFSGTNWVKHLFRQVTTFRNLKDLKFHSSANVKLDVSKLCALLKACPLMEKLHLVIKLAQEPGGRLLQMASESMLENLKDVYIGGFCFTPSYLELALYILEHGDAIEKMVINPKLEFCFLENYMMRNCSRVTWDDGERAKVCSFLQNYPKSSLIIVT